MMIGAEVYLWGTRIGLVVQDDLDGLPYFAYDTDFIKAGIEVSPITMPLSERTYSFPGLREETFRKLPGLLADSLPDKFGTKLINDYLIRQGRTPDSLSSVERLCFVGSRGMGALEFVPQKGFANTDDSISIDELAKLAEQILTERKNIQVTANKHAMEQLIKVGTSAGGARAKALIAWNENTGSIRSGQVNAGDGYSYWLIKFGGISNNKDKDNDADAPEYTKIEYAYSLMAKDCGINMTECRLLKSSEGLHFTTKRFDRDSTTGHRLHMQSLGGLAHFDFNDPGAYSYEQASWVMAQLNLSQSENEQLFRRMVFNEIAKNYDDHVKNISFLMDRNGTWRLAPAYDMTFSYNPTSIWTASHQMRINGKRDNLNEDDLITTGLSMNLSKRKVLAVLEQVVSVVQKWNQYAEYVELSEQNMKSIQSFHKCYNQYCDSTIDLPLLANLQSENKPAYTILD